jgi:hypothetical protein
MLISSFTGRIEYCSKEGRPAMFTFKLLRPAPLSEDQIGGLGDEVLNEMKRRGPLSTQRIESLKNLFAGRKCYASELTRYFGMSMPGDMAICEQCTWCTTKSALRI